MSQPESIVHAAIARAISEATQEVFTTMLALEAVSGEPVVSQSEPGYHENVVALLGLTGQWSGSGQLSVEPLFACKIASQMLMAEYSSVDNDVLDAIAEIANMVVGNIKNLLEPELGPMGLSTPTIVYGGEFETRVAGTVDRVTTPFTCGDGSLTVRILLSPKHDLKLHAARHRLEEPALSR
jgi:chemotaxis protein CheX